jgi:hypothetical protein
MGTRVSIIFGLILLGGCASGVQQDPPSHFIVFFSGDSATLTPEAQLIVKDAASRIRDARPATVMIAAGVKAGDNMDISEPRFQAVREALVADGIEPAIIARAPLPGPKLAVVDGGLSSGDERAEIRLLARGP